jgi:hypothetical protein
MEGMWGVEVRRSCAAKHREQHGVGWSWQKSNKMTANGECGEAGRRDLLGSKAENDEWCRSTQSFRAVVEMVHAAVLIMKGGERSWISAAVSLSMTSIGPPH